ncbi:oligosaccharide repeat unit polymerase [Pelagibacterium flavum]|uniref:Oligosaccharide repeat unit polymerase n=1 Tax=Pelagibacterium flavum TaxID=2984530 RepID=A0ABY6INQ7_9HYPH|nr:O-antigen polymerase [Pelagibacterium sp. YIM 151497]UYQ70957.1 oligosaccharide repeat unit polymerase [Pelagibacterium sp. YIM 151497]
MAANEKARAGNWLLGMPSFWGLMAWTVACSAYIFTDIGWNRPSAHGLSAMVWMTFCYLISLAVFSPRFRDHFNQQYEPAEIKVSTRWAIALHLLGIGFCLLYVHDIEQSGYLEGSFWAALVNSPMDIRQTPMAGMTRGVQLSYIGWLAVFLSGLSLAVSRKNAKTHILLTLLQLAANLIFMSKMRPFAVILLFVLPYLIFNRHRFSLTKLMALAAALMAGLVGFFIFWSEATGKTAGINQGYPPAVETFLRYLTSGPAYLSHILIVETPDYSLARTLRPIYTFMAVIFGTEAPPSRILEFYSIRLTTNVGTALEPWYRDMGLIGVLVGALVLSFGLDAMAYWGVKFGRLSGHLLAVMMCYCSIFAFFVPRLTTGAVVAVLGIFLIHWVIGAASTSAQFRAALQRGRNS